MSGTITAAVVVAAGAAGAAYMSNKAASDAADKQAQGTAASLAQQQQGMDFQMANYEKNMQDVAQLEDIFGPIRDNLAKYYNNISPEMFQLQGKEAIESQYQRTQKNVDAMFSNNGMYSSGQHASAQLALESAREQLLGQNRQNAVNQYNQQEMNWLNWGTNQQNNLRNVANGQAAGIVNSNNNMANTVQQGGNMQAQIGMHNAQGWGQFGSGMMQLGGYMLGGGFGNSTFGGSTSLSSMGAINGTNNYGNLSPSQIASWGASNGLQG